MYIFNDFKDNSDIAHWSKSPLASSRLVGKFRNYVEYTDFSQLLLNFRKELILYLLKRKILRLLINPEKNYEDFFLPFYEYILNSLKLLDNVCLPMKSF